MLYQGSFLPNYIQYVLLVTNPFLANILPDCSVSWLSGTMALTLTDPPTNP